MRFCTQCGNMYYIKIKNEGEDNLIYYCRKCGFEDNSISDDASSLCVSKTHISGDNSSNLYSQVINKYTKLDPTLPRINTIRCPNTDCSTNDNESKNNGKAEIIYLRYDETNLKYVYLCPTCDHIWKT
jgi:DNA-directed RNA polymerase subunit M/transcription elongation factor TFIIS